jgi:hypothetical protein
MLVDALAASVIEAWHHLPEEIIGNVCLKSSELSLRMMVGMTMWKKGDIVTVIFFSDVIVQAIIEMLH